MNYIKHFEELDFFKRLARSSKPEEIGREPIFGPKKEEPKKKEKDPNSKLRKEVLEWLNSDELKSKISAIEPSENLQPTLTFNREYLLKSIKSNNLLKDYIQDCKIHLNLKDFSFYIFISLKRDINNIYDIGRTKEGGLNYILGISTFLIQYSIIKTSTGYFAKNTDNLKINIGNIIDSIGRLLDKISDVISSMVDRQKEIQEKEKIRREQEEIEKKRLHQFASNLEEISDYLIELEDLAGGEKHCSKKIANHYMWFEYHIEKFKFYEGSVILNDTAVEVFKAVAYAKKQILEDVPECEVAIQFSNKLVKVWVKLLPPNLKKSN